MNYRIQLQKAKKALLAEDALLGRGTLGIIECDMHQWAEANQNKMSERQRDLLKRYNNRGDGTSIDGFLARWDKNEGTAMSPTVIMLRTVRCGAKISLPEVYATFCHEAGHLRCYWNGCNCYTDDDEHKVLRERHACEAALKDTLAVGDWKGIYFAVASAYWYATEYFKGNSIYRPILKSAVYKDAMRSLPLAYQLNFL